MSLSVCLFVRRIFVLGLLFVGVLFHWVGLLVCVYAPGWGVGGNVDPAEFP